MPFDRREQSDLEQELRSARPRAPRRFISALAAAAGPARSGFRGRRPLTVAIVGAASLAVMGGIGFAASSAIEGSQVAVKRVAADGAREIAVRNAASAAYVDPGKVTTADGPPQLTVAQRTDAAGKPIPVVAKAIANDSDVTLNTSLTVNESGTLSIQVLDANDEPVKIDCKRTTVQGGEVGTGEAKICRVVINTPTSLQISIKVPSRQLDSGEELTIRLGYTDKDAGAKRTVVDTPAKAPARLPTVTRTFRLSADDVADIRNALEETGRFAVTFRAFVTGESPSVRIDWAGRTTTTAKSIGPVRYARQAAVDRDAVVTVTGGEIGGGDFKVFENGCPSTVTYTARSRYTINAYVTVEPGCAGDVITLKIQDPADKVVEQAKRTVGSDNTVSYNFGLPNELLRNTPYKISATLSGTVSELTVSTLR